MIPLKHMNNQKAFSGLFLRRIRSRLLDDGCWYGSRIRRYSRVIVALRADRAACDPEPTVLGGGFPLSPRIRES
jgi:hypothetical protein